MADCSTAINKLISVATAELGYLEKASNSNLDSKTANAGFNNWNKYARDLDNKGNIYNGPKNGYDWCCIFAHWCFHKAFGTETAMKMLYVPYKDCGAGCTWCVKYFKNNKHWVTTPNLGDQIFFTDDNGASSYHTGIVVEVKNGRVYTIEGNTSNSSDVVANGGCVAKKNYPLGANYIMGYGRPEWSLVKIEPEKQNSNTSEKKEGTKEVKYNKISEVPSWARNTIIKLVSKGYISGSGKKDENGLPIDMDLSMDMIRILVIADRAGLFG